MPDKPKVLFVCVQNAGRSRMAEAFLEAVAGDRYEAVSAGTEPAERPHPEVVEAMRDIGLEIPERPGRRLTGTLAGEATRVIGMGCAVEQACPALSVPLEDWDLPDPKDGSVEDVRRVRDEIRARVEGLVAELDAERGAG